MKKLFLLIVAVFLCFSSAITAQNLENPATIDTFQTSQSVTNTTDTASTSVLKKHI
jgi:CHASE3 domain sensor protein